MFKRCLHSLRLAVVSTLVLNVLPFASVEAAQPPITTPLSRTSAQTAYKHNIDPKDPNPALYIVQLEGTPLALDMSVPRRAKSGKPDFAASLTNNARARLAAQRQTLLTAAGQVLGKNVTPVYSYDTAFHGMALRLTGAEAARIATLPGVISIEREQYYETTTDAGPTWIEANTIWDASATGVYAATLLGDNQTPAVSSPASGRATFNFSASSNTLDYTIITTGFTQAITAAQLQRDTDDSVVGSLVVGATAGTYVGSVVLSAGDVTLLQNGQLYINLATGSNPGGEIRGDVKGYQGEGVTVGIIDSGINTTHPSFAAVGGDGYHHLNPLGKGNYKGACDPNNLPSSANGNPSGYNPTIVCNDKLIGAWTFAETAPIPSPINEPSPNDDNGHGSHTASTAAGNVLFNMMLNGATFPRISGVAPHANIIAYDVCGYIFNGSYSASCPAAALLAAINQATADGVDVINYSISGGNNPWTDSVELAFRNARAAGIVVATSAGNSGPTASTVAHLSPWLMSVAASTHNRKLINTITNLSANGGATLPNMTGLGMSGGLNADTPIVYAGSGSIGNSLCGPFTSGQAALVSGKIVICDRGTYGRVEKAQNVQNAGGVGYILANNLSSGSSLVSDPYPIPGVHITYNDGVTLKNWVAANTNPVGRITGTTSDLTPSNGDVMASFSSRGPAQDVFANIIKPDLAAPGVDVIAAYKNSGGNTPDVTLLSGTSMASPHAAGAAALLAGLHPDWTPGQIQSALMTTGLAPIKKEDGATATTPFDSGAGRIRLERAAQAGLVLDESISNFENADPNADGDPRMLNIPSMADPTCVFSCSWLRTFKNTLSVPVTWNASTSSAQLSVSPASFTIPANGTQTVSVTMDVSSLPTNGQYSFGRVTFSAVGGLAPDASLPVAVVPIIGTIPTSLVQHKPSGVFSAPLTLRTIAYSDLAVENYGLVKGTPADLHLLGAENDVRTITIDANAKRLVAEILSTTSLDADIYVYKDDGNTSLDGADTLMCASASTAVLEYCNLIDPSVGTYFVKVENYTASSSAGDSIRLVTAVVPTSNAGNFSISAPTSHSGGDVDVTIGINEPSSQLGDTWYGWFSLTDNATATLLGTTSYDFHHELGLPSSLVATSGTPQSATVSSAFAQPLAVKITDAGNNPLANVQVNFSAPSSGASAMFPQGNAAMTDQNGALTLPVQANSTAGNYTVTASVQGENGLLTATFALTNEPIVTPTLPPGSITVTGGASQNAPVNGSFTTPLSVLVKDSNNNPLANVQVSFSAPSSGASATFPQGNTALSNQLGIATVLARANGVSGSYLVTATIQSPDGPLTTTFALTNTAQSQPQSERFFVYLPTIRRQ